MAAQPVKRSEGRLRMLQRYCDDLCAVPELAQSDIALEFFWPSRNRMNESVEAPDGSTAIMTGESVIGSSSACVDGSD